MAVWTTPKTWNVGDILTAADMNIYVRDNSNFLFTRNGELNYTEFTTNVTTSATTEGTAGTVVTASSGLTFDGVTKILVEFFSPNVNVGTGSRWTNFWLYDGATSIGGIGETDSPTAGFGGMAMCHREFTPPAATKTYGIRASVGGGAGTSTIVADVGGITKQPPGFIRISKA